MGRRRKHDVFVIGDEFDAETTVLEDPAGPADDQAPGGHPQPPGLGPPSPPRARRGLAVLATAAAMAAALWVLVSSLGTAGGPEGHSMSSSRSALVHRPTPRATESPAQRSRLLPSPRGPEPSQGRPAAAGHSGPTDHEPEREPTRSEAPESSLTVTYPPPSEPTAPALPAPSPPPPSGGGGLSVHEDFGFER